MYQIQAGPQNIVPLMKQGLIMDFITSLLRQRAEQGDAESQNDLGTAYYTGQGVEQDFSESVRWWSRAAASGLAGAQFNMALAYYSGLGVRQDYREAVKWNRLAAEQGQDAKAHEWGEKYLAYSQNMDQSIRLDAVLLYAQGLEGVGRYQEAIEAFRHFHELSDSLNLSANAAQLNLLNKRLEIDELKGQQEREKMEHEHTRLQLLLIIGALIVLSLLIFIFFRHRAAKRLETAYYELAEKNKALVVANARAEESSRMKTDFIQQISHEIRTPLNILSGFTQIITTPGVKLDDATRAEANEKITENTDRITSLVNKMLELAETNSKVVIEMNDHVTLGEIVAGAIGESGIEDVADVKFTLRLDSDIATKEILTNAQALQRALAQLLDNASKFRKADAYNTVTFAVGIIASRLSFSVEDTGIGVPPEQSEHIFEEFVQLDKYKVGTGIGLTIARSLARRMGGDIVLDTAYTAGARFVLMLPLK